jgi:hypothetical protein
MNYIDKHGRIHDKPVTPENPLSSNNAFLYSAVYLKLGGKLSLDMVAFWQCANHLTRHPQEEVPPISRDEILGLEFIRPGSTEVINHSWSFSPYPLPKFSLVKLLVQASKLVDWRTFKLLHRNTFHEQGLDQIYHLAFLVPWSDRHTILKLNGKYSAWWHLVHVLLNRPSKSRSGRQLYWFKTGKDIQGVIDYYQPGHPSRVLAEKIKAIRG